MVIEYRQGIIKAPKKPATVIFVSSDPTEGDGDPELLALRYLTQPLVKSGAFRVGQPEILPLLCQGQEGWLLLVGLDELTRAGLLEATARATEKLNSLGVEKATFVVPTFANNSLETMEPMAYGLTLAMEQRPDYKTKNDARPKTLKKVVFLDDEGKITQAEGQDTVDRACIVALAQLRARVLTDRPANLLYPEMFAQEALDLAQKFGLSVIIWDEKKLAKEGAGGILAVGSGSVKPPRVVVLEYKGPGVKAKDRPIALVGKGITFDSGGLCLKPPENMAQMKTDMAGAAAVLSTICTAAELEMPISIVGIIPLAENLIGGAGFRPGDVITTLSGQTVEIMNTDAEGRIILCDALTLAQRYKPYRLIDIATLTGACVVALGEGMAGLFSNNRELSDEIIRAGHTVAEDFWPLPLYGSYDERLKSDLADFKEMSGRAGGSIVAALFLRRFIENGLIWAHLDIAGTARNQKKKPSCPEGASGFGVRTLLKLLADAAAHKSSA
jgi:leucyl aminopeptidase